MSMLSKLLKKVQREIRPILQEVLLEMALDPSALKDPKLLKEVQRRLRAKIKEKHGDTPASILSNQLISTALDDDE